MPPTWKSRHHGDVRRTCSYGRDRPTSRSRKSRKWIDTKKTTTMHGRRRGTTRRTG